MTVPEATRELRAAMRAMRRLDRLSKVRKRGARVPEREPWKLVREVNRYIDRWNAWGR